MVKKYLFIMSYSVVHFFDDESVEALLSFWVKGKTCA